MKVVHSKLQLQKTFQNEYETAARLLEEGDPESLRYAQNWMRGAENTLRKMQGKSPKQARVKSLQRPKNP